MAVLQNLKALNKSSARIASFACRISGGAVEKYTYQEKKTGQDKTVHKFEAYLVGNNAQEYCRAYVKGSEQECKKAADKFKDGTVWALSKVVWDTWTKVQYISTPVPFRIDLSKSVMTAQDEDSQVQKKLRKDMPSSPEPPISVADVSLITTTCSTDLIAVVKDVADKTRVSKAGELIVDITLVDTTVGSSGKVVVIDVSVFGADKFERLKAAVGTPMAFFNLSIACDKKGEKPKITHYGSEKLAPAPESRKTAELRKKAAELQAANDTEKLTQIWEPTDKARDVSGPQTLSCAAFLDYTSESRDAFVPEVTQVMWIHPEEPPPGHEILFQERIWFLLKTRDGSGNLTVSCPQRCALELANVADQQTFIAKHASEELNFPLLCHARVCRTIREDGEKTYVNHQLEKVEPVSWDPLSAPNATYTDVLAILNNCPPNEDGIVFACLADLQPDPFSGWRTSYDGSPGPKGVFAAVMIASNRKSDRNAISENGYKVITNGVKDMVNPAENETTAVGDHTLVGYCTLTDLPSFTLDPPRGKEHRVALVLINKVDAEGFHVHKTENIEPDQVANAIQCMQRLRRMSKQIHPTCEGKRSRNMSLTTDKVKKARKLQAVPTDVSLPDCTKDCTKDKQ